MLKSIRWWVSRVAYLSVMVATLVFSSNIRADQQTILVVGDSLSAAYRMPAEQGWVMLMQQQLNQQLQQQGISRRVQVVNSSVSGATTAAGLQWLPAALAEHQPNIVILALGANDGLQGKPLGLIKRNLQRLISLAKNAHATVVLVGIRLPPNYGAAYTDPFFAQFAELADSEGLAYVPFLLDGVAGNRSLMMADGLHPKADAQVRVLENISPVITPLVLTR